jgi:hypothetical protein
VKCHRPQRQRLYESKNGNQPRKNNGAGDAIMDEAEGECSGAGDAHRSTTKSPLSHNFQRFRTRMM